MRLLMPSSSEKNCENYSENLKQVLTLRDDGYDFLQKNKDLINCQDHHGKTPLHYLFDNQNNGNRYVNKNNIKLLLDAGASVEFADNEGKTVLHYAMTLLPGLSDTPRIIQQLITAGADVNAVDNNGQSILHLAHNRFHSQYHSTDTISLLISKGADINLRSKPWGYTILHVFASKGYPLTSLLTSSTDLSLQAKDGTALHLLATRGGEEFSSLVKYIQKHRGVETFNIISKFHDMTALALAALYDNHHIVRILLEAGADCDIVGKSGWSALHSAAVTGNINTIKLLLMYDTYPELKNQNGDSPYDLALKFQNSAAVGLLQQFSYHGRNQNYEFPGYQEPVEIPPHNETQPVGINYHIIFAVMVALIFMYLKKRRFI